MANKRLLFQEEEESVLKKKQKTSKSQANGVISTLDCLLFPSHHPVHYFRSCFHDVDQWGRVGEIHLRLGRVTEQTRAD
jgi:hypothetical protein